MLVKYIVNLIAIFIFLLNYSIALSDELSNTKSIEKIIIKNLGFTNKIIESKPLEFLLNRITPYQTDDNLKLFLKEQVESLGVSLIGFKEFHYNRNLLNSSEPSYEKIKAKFGPPLPREKSIFHMIGPENSENEKFISPDGKEEYVFYKSIDENEKIIYKLVTNPVNIGTYNLVGPVGRLGTAEHRSNLYWHLVLDVLPWLLWGNSPNDTTTSFYRKQLYYWQSISGFELIHQAEGLSDIGISRKDAAENVVTLLHNCNCDSSNELDSNELDQAKPIDLINNDDLNNDNKEQITNRPPTNNDNDDDDNFPNLGFVAGKVLGEPSLFTGNLYTGKEGGGDAPVGQRGEARLKAGVNTVYSDNVDPDIQIAITSPPNDPKQPDSEGFIYTRWGSWDGAGKIIPGFANKDAERGYYVIGRSTHIDDIPRSGSAEYNGEVKGVAFNGESIGGTVILNADFENKIFNGTFHLQRANGTSWVNLKTGAMPYSLDDGRNFEITFSNNGAGTVETPAGTTVVGAGNNVRGSFFGKAGEEVAGDWAVYGVPDAVGGADGVFRAKK